MLEGNEMFDITLKYKRELYQHCDSMQHGIIVTSQSYRIFVASRFEFTESFTPEILKQESNDINIERFRMRERIESRSRFNDPKWIKYYTDKCLARLSLEVNYRYQEQLLEKNMEIQELNIKWEEIDQWN